MGATGKRATGIGGTALLTGALLTGSLLTACGADSGDFKSSAERFIEGDRMATESGTTFTDAVCQEPSTTSVGTTFKCAATDAAGADWTFDVTIVDDSNFQITGRRSG